MPKEAAETGFIRAGAVGFDGDLMPARGGVETHLRDCTECAAVLRSCAPSRHRRERRAGPARCRSVARDLHATSPAPGLGTIVVRAPRSVVGIPGGAARAAPRSPRRAAVAPILGGSVVGAARATARAATQPARTTPPSPRAAPDLSPPGRDLRRLAHDGHRRIDGRDDRRVPMRRDYGHRAAAGAGANRAGWTADGEDGRSEPDGDRRGDRSRPARWPPIPRTPT